jgi:flagellar motor switch protein FliN/FliY
LSAQARQKGKRECSWEWRLDRRVDDPVELYVGDRLIARGELTELEGDNAGQLAVRLTEVANLRGGL